MKSKYTEKFKHGLALGAAALALNGCDTAKKAYGKTLESASKAYDPIDARLRMNECLKKARPERSDNIELLDNDVDRPYPGLLGDVVDLRCGAEPNAIRVVNDCEITVYTDDFTCYDGDTDGVWESVSKEVKPFDFKDMLVPADRIKNPKKWQNYQNKCNDAFNRCLD